MDNPYLERRAARPSVRVTERRKPRARRFIVMVLVAVWLAVISGFLFLLVSQRFHRIESKSSAPLESSKWIASPRTAKDKPTPPAELPSSVSNADLNNLFAMELLIPVAGVTPSQLRDTFNQERGGGRLHQALDIVAPQGTAVLATSDGVVLKLFQSANGGTTLYQLDPSHRYSFYYAHLMRYADGMIEGKQLHRGDVIGYVGDTGNAGVGNFHLHFAISKLVSPLKWSGGDPIDPYPLLGGR